MVTDVDIGGEGWEQGYPERDDDGDVTCPRCGQPIDPSDFVCAACGRALADIATDESEEAVASW